MKVSGEVVIIGAGITGVMAGHMLNQASPETQITFIDAGNEPDALKENLNHGATLGQGRDARHFTGTEGLSYQNPVHTELITKLSGSDVPGWQTIPEEDLSGREKAWRAEMIDRYSAHVTPTANPYDTIYTEINYAGMAGWKNLLARDPSLKTFRLAREGIRVAFASDEELETDLISETNFNPYRDEDPVKLQPLRIIGPDVATKSLAQQVLRVPGEAWRIKSVWQYLKDQLQATGSVNFKWDQEISDSSDLPKAETYIWANGNGYCTPEFCVDNSRVQGIGGWWLTLSNSWFRDPFKFSAPQPSGYINFTPDGREVHVSGGFGWVGEREFAEAEMLLGSTKKHFLEDVAHFLGRSVASLDELDLGCCIRPTTPTGLPDLKTVEFGDSKHIVLVGAGKAGATQAPILGLHAVGEILGVDKALGLVSDSLGHTEKTLISNALAKTKAGLEPRL